MAGRPNTKWLETMIAKHGSREAVREHQARIGALGGARSSGGGFASFTHCYCDVIAGSHYKQQCAGAIGGRISRRGRKGYQPDSADVIAAELEREARELAA